MVDREIEQLLREFDAFSGEHGARLVAGHAEYGEAWRERDNLAALCEEGEDAFVYGFFDWLQGRRARQAGDPHTEASKGPHRNALRRALTRRGYGTAGDRASC